jgi:hypothetical protein
VYYSANYSTVFGGKSMSGSGGGQPPAYRMLGWSFIPQYGATAEMRFNVRFVGGNILMICWKHLPFPPG